jgi:hypothetical protein
MISKWQRFAIHSSEFLLLLLASLLNVAGFSIAAAAISC